MVPFIIAFPYLYMWIVEPSLHPPLLPPLASDDFFKIKKALMQGWSSSGPGGNFGWSWAGISRSALALSLASVPIGRALTLVERAMHEVKVEYTAEEQRDISRAEGMRPDIVPIACCNHFWPAAYIPGPGCSYTFLARAASILAFCSHF
jgi:hypothetical protein